MLDGLIRDIMGRAMGALLLQATLHKATITRDDYGEQVATFADHAVRASPDDWTANHRQVFEIPATDIRIIMLQAGMPVAVAVGDEATIRGVRYRVVALREDAAGAAWDIQGRPV